MVITEEFSHCSNLVKFAFQWLSAGQSLSESCLCVEWLPLCISVGITTVHSGAISIATVLHSATGLRDFEAAERVRKSY